MCSGTLSLKTVWDKEAAEGPRRAGSAAGTQPTQEEVRPPRVAPRHPIGWVPRADREGSRVCCASLEWCPSLRGSSRRKHAFSKSSWLGGLKRCIRMSVGAKNDESVRGQDSGRLTSCVRPWMLRLQDEIRLSGV